MPGNIDLYAQPEVRNGTGWSTVASIGNYDDRDGTETVMTSVTPDGRLLNPDQAIDWYRQTGKHLGKFATPSAGAAFAGQLHDDYEAGRYKPWAKPMPSHPQQQALQRALK